MADPSENNKSSFDNCEVKGTSERSVRQLKRRSRRKLKKRQRISNTGHCQ
jgi:hypothetical protein